MAASVVARLRPPTDPRGSLLEPPSQSFEEDSSPEAERPATLEVKEASNELVTVSVSYAMVMLNIA